jgi:hypothetical protein
MKRLTVLFILLICFFLLFITGCDREKQDKPVPKAKENPFMFTPEKAGKIAQQEAAKPEEPRSSAQPQSPHGDVKTSKKIVVPGDVKGKWHAVMLVIEDKVTGKSKDVQAKISSSIEMPGTGLKVNVGEFLPDFTMHGTKITSKSNEPRNPAVQVEVFEKGQGIFKGWLYSRFPDIHPFEHERYRLTLKEGIKN